MRKLVGSSYEADKKHNSECKNPNQALRENGFPSLIKKSEIQPTVSEHANPDCKNANYSQLASKVKAPETRNRNGLLHDEAMIKHCYHTNTFTTNRSQVNKNTLFMKEVDALNKNWN